MEVHELSADSPWKLHLNDGIRLYGRTWSPQGDVRGIVLILHGMGEHSRRYADFAKFLNTHGYLVFAYDQRGHGDTGENVNMRGYLGDMGFFRIINDVDAVLSWIRGMYPDHPLYLFGHSMGSFVAQGYLERESRLINGCILCGTNGPEGARLYFGIALARRYARKHGPLSESKRLTWLTFGMYNRRFRPIRTPYDWLSRDPDIIDAFLADAQCGFPLSAASMGDMFKALLEMYKWSNLQRIPRTLPILIIAGELDPVGHQGRGIRKLEKIYRRIGMTNLRVKLYPNARHELLHELNRLEVFGDVLDWLNLQCKTKNQTSSSTRSVEDQVKAYPMQ